MLFEANIDNITTKNANFTEKNKQMFDESQKRETFYHY
jgi:hypothetical protein